MLRGFMVLVESNLKFTGKEKKIFDADDGNVLHALTVKIISISYSWGHCDSAND